MLKWNFIHVVSELISDLTFLHSAQIIYNQKCSPISVLEIETTMSDPLITVK